MTMKILGKGVESRRLYTLDTQVPKSIAFSRTTTPFEEHFRLRHLLLSLLKKVCPQFSCVVT